MDPRYLRPSRVYSRTPRPDRGSTATPSPPQKQLVRMDPDCAICGSPANTACECESKSLEMAIKHAEQRIMQSVYDDIRAWVRGHAQDYILAHFTQLTERRKTAHAAHLDRITSHAYYHYQSPPHPNEMVAAQATLKRGIDQDWQASVQRYPEVLEYFFGLVELTLPGDGEPGVKDPPSNALTGGRKAGRRPTNIQAGHMYDPDMALPPPRQGSTPPHAQMMVRRPTSPHANVGRRTPGPASNGALPPARMNRINYRGGAPPGPPPAQSYYPPY